MKKIRMPKYGRNAVRSRGVRDSAGSPKKSNERLQKTPDFGSPVVITTLIEKSRYRPIDSRVIMLSKACDVVTDQQDTAERTSEVFPIDQYQKELLEQYGFDPILPANVSKMVTIQKMLTGGVAKVETSSQCANPATISTGTNNTTELWCNVNNIEDVENNLRDDKMRYAAKDVQIAETPRLKVIAEKFSRFKKNHIEIRRLEERIICVEYDVFDRDNIFKKPIQVMRAYFCIKVGCDGCKNAMLNAVAPTIKNSQLSEETLLNDSEKELEMIDDKLPENKPYLDELRKILKKRQAISSKKKKSTLDLKSMYNMARNNMPALDHDFSNTNLLSKAELQEIKELILKKCESRVYNVSRRRMNKNENDVTKDKSDKTDKTDSMFTDMLRRMDSNLK